MQVYSSGQIAEQIALRLGIAVDRDVVQYALRKGKIKPEGRAGGTYLYSEAAIDAVVEFLKNKRIYAARTKEA